MENTAKTSTDSAITGKKTHKPGGCVGIFFQLVDWKRRLAQKKLFPKKFLPPDRAKQCYKKFKAMEKMPSSKLHLISDENSGSFVNRKTSEHEMRAPTLVARLMGLESMPLLNRGKAKKASVSEYCKKGSEREGRNFEKGSATIDSRPQKLQKNDYSEKRVVTRFGPEALPFKSVLSQARNNHRQPKLPLPTNSPRYSSGRSVKRTSRLIDAASRILEPGLLATSRAKCAFTYSNRRTHGSCGGLRERIEVLPLDEHNAANSFAGTTSCEISDSFPGIGRVKRNTVEEPFIYHALDSPETGRSKKMPSGDLFFENNGHKSIDVSFVSEPAVGQYRSPSASSHPRKLRRRASSSSPFRQGNQPQNQTSPGREKFSARSEISNLRSGRVSLSANFREGSKDSDAFNHGICSRRSATVLTELESSKFHLEKTTMNGREERHPQLRTFVRKRRMVGAGGFVDSHIVVDSSNSKQRNLDCDRFIGRRLGLDPCSTNCSCAEIKLDGQGEAGGVYGKNRDVVSFAFRSPTRPTDRIPAAMEGEIMDYRRRVSFQEQYGLSEDAIGTLIEQKLIELSSPKDDEITAAASAKRSADIILQELIAALTDDFRGSHDCSITKLNVDSNAKAGTEISMGNHFIPGSVIEASFSSSSMDDGSSTNTRSRLPVDATDYTTDHFQPLEADLFDSAANKIGSGRLNEIIESKYSRFYISGSNALTTRLVSRLPGRKMIKDFVDEVEEWTSFMKMCLDEMIKLEMNQSTGKWTNFSFEGLETGADIEQDILQLLVEEVLVDMSIHPLKLKYANKCS